MSIRNYLIALSLIAGFALCSCSDSKKESKTAYLPVARGKESVILAVMDSAKWHGDIGNALRATFAAPVPGLPQDEPFFKVRHINPLKLNSILKTAKNMLFVTTLDDQSAQSRAMRRYMTDGSLKRIQADTSLYMFLNKDEFAKGQQILHLFGNNDKLLINKINTNSIRLRNHFLKVEEDRIRKVLFKSEEKNIKKKLVEDHAFSLRIPYGYDLAKNLKDFVWIRLLDPAYEKNIFVHYEPYTSQEPFNEPLAHRAKITSTYMRDIEKPDIYMTLQDFPTEQEEVNFKGKYAKETRGLWKLSDISGGGPFLSYVFVDESQKRIYYIEGYVFAPSKDKRAFMREIEVILSTFKSGKEL